MKNAGSLAGEIGLGHTPSELGFSPNPFSDSFALSWR
jgi:hypothetical protein